LSKATLKFARGKNRGKRQEMAKSGKMAEPLTNAILISILHLIRWDLNGNQSRLAPPHRRRCRIHQSGPRAVTTTPSYQPMELSPPHSSMPPVPPFGTPYTPSTTMDLEHLTGPSKSITMFTATRSSWWGPSTSQQQEVSRVPATESGWGHRRWTRWSGARLISRSAADREPPTPMEIHHQQRRTPKTLTLMGQWVGLWFTAAKAFPTWKLGHPPGDPVTLLNPDPTDRRHRCPSFRLMGVASPVQLIEPGEGGGRGRRWAAHRSGEGWQRWWVCTRRVTWPGSDNRVTWWWSTRSRGGDNKEEETEDRLDHWRKHGGSTLAARVQTLSNTRNVSDVPKRQS
jgi:hypothetical protein